MILPLFLLMFLPKLMNAADPDAQKVISLGLIQITFTATDKALFSSEKMLISFLFLNKNICCGYSLEAPR